MSINNFRSAGVKIILADKKERVLKFTFGAFRVLAQTYGSVTTALKGFADVDALKELSIETIDLIVNLIHAGLRHEDKSLKPADVEDLITTENLAECVIAIGRALGLSLPDPEENENPQIPQ